MRALVIYESMFGNTRDVATAIGAGLGSSPDAEVVEVADAPAVLPADVTLLVVGGPTHAFGMSRASTREEARKLADGPLVSRGDGLREWFERLERPTHGVLGASFDTHMDKPRVIAQMGSASGPVRRRLHRLGIEDAADPQHFWVSDTTGPLRDGELDRAREWGRTLATHVRGTVGGPA